MFIAEDKITIKGKISQGRSVVKKANRIGEGIGA